jgi:3-oxoacyl-[acyl-carrier protein] reductase
MADQRSIDMSNLNGKTALVTGASRGIGRSTALTLAKAGARVLVHYSSGETAADAVVAEIRTAGGEAMKVAADLSAKDGAHQLAQRVRTAAERLDILVANAGVAKAATFEETTVEDFDRMYAVNVRAPYFLVQQLLPILNGGGSIVLISSLAAASAVPNVAAYAATKGAVSTLVRHLAGALGPKGIRVNGIAPGVIETDMASMIKSEAGRTMVLGLQALQRIGQPGDVADVVEFLVSNDARWITGDVLAVDGGTKL